MDAVESGWILEFLIHQDSIDNQTLNDLIRVLPLPNNNPTLKKLLILRQINFDIEKGKLSEKTLQFLEQIEQLNFAQENYRISESLKAAYCYVAMHCTTKLFEETCVNDIDNDSDNVSVIDRKEKYVNAVKKIWSSRINAMERNNVVGLVQEDLLNWVNDVENGVLDLNVCENVSEMFKETDVFKVLKRFVNEEKEKMGPSFLEKACETIVNDDELREFMGWDVGNGEGNGVRSVGEGVDVNVGSKGNEVLKDNVLPKHKHVSPRRNRVSGHGTRRGAKIVDPLESSQERRNYISTPEVNRVQEALETSLLELHAMVTDPLPEALGLPESVKCNTSKENARTRGNEEAPSSSLDKKGKALDLNGDDGSCRDQNKKKKPSLMEHNSTAHTVEWSDSIEDSSEEGSPTRPHLPSPKRRAVSPLSVYKMEKLARQRKKKRWSILEEDTLRNGVKKHGKGNWKMILNMYRDIFEDRTEVDLKDKWRNLTR